MFKQNTGRRGGGFSPVILRLAVGGIFAWAGWQNFQASRGAHRLADQVTDAGQSIGSEPSTDAPAGTAEDAVDAAMAGIQGDTAGALDGLPAGEAALPGIGAPDAAGALDGIVDDGVVDEQGVQLDLSQSGSLSTGLDLPAQLDERGLKVDFRWQQLVGLGEWGFALAILFGILTRLAALSGVAFVTVSALASHGMINGAGTVSRFVEMYEANPLAMLLFGAICLSLFFTGSGRCAVDRRLFGRRQRAIQAAQANGTHVQVAG